MVDKQKMQGKCLKVVYKDKTSEYMEGVRMVHVMVDVDRQDSRQKGMMVELESHTKNGCTLIWWGLFHSGMWSFHQFVCSWLL